MIAIRPPYKAVTLHELKKMQTPTNEKAKSYWRAVPHGSMVGLCLRFIPSVSKTTYHANENGDFVGSFDFSYKTHTLSLCVLNSNSRRYSLQISIGMVEDGLGLPIYFDDGPKHTQSIMEVAEEKIQEALALKEDCIKIRSSMDRKIFTEDEELQLIIKVGREGFMPWSHLGEVDMAWLLSKKLTTWGMYKIMSGINRKANPLDQMKRLYNILKVIQGEENSHVERQ